MHRIVHLRFDQNHNCFWMESTDYDPMNLEQAESIVTELNRDAIQSSLPDRWIVGQD